MQTYSEWTHSCIAALIAGMVWLVFIWLTVVGELSSLAVRSVHERHSNGLRVEWNADARILDAKHRV